MRRVDRKNIDKEIVEEYRRWKKSVTFLYDYVMAYALEWPSSVFQWLPEITPSPDENVSLHKVLVSTRCLNEEDSELRVLEVQVPNGSKPFEFWGLHEGPTVVRNDDRSMNLAQERFGIFHPVSHKVKVLRRVKHNSRIKAAEIMPFNKNMVCSTSTRGCDVFVFDLEKNFKCENSLNPDVVLANHDSPGVSVDWNTKAPGVLASSSSDDVISIWDLNSCKSKINRKPLVSFCYPDRIPLNCSLEDNDESNNGFTSVQWHPSQPTAFATSDVHRKMMVWDTRSRVKSKPSHEVVAHTDVVTSLAFSPHNDASILTSSHDKTLALWDLRNLSVKIHSLIGHKEPVSKVLWSPHDNYLTTSCELGKWVIMWDLSRIGEKVQPHTRPEDPTLPQEVIKGLKKSGGDVMGEPSPPPEILFKHCGHSARVSGFSWHPSVKNLIGSVADDNILQLWAPTQTLIDLPKA